MDANLSSYRKEYEEQAGISFWLTVFHLTSLKSEWRKQNSYGRNDLSKYVFNNCH